MPNAAQNDAITKLYIGYYGRAPDPGGFAFWQQLFDARLAQGMGEAEAIVSLAELFGSKDQAETIAQYPFLSDPANLSAAPFVISIYQNLLNRTVETSDAGVQFWIGQIASGALTPGKVIQAIIDAASSTGDAQVLANKLSVANSWREQVEAAGNVVFDANAATQSRVSIAKVNSDNATVALASNDASSFVNQSKPVNTFTLTTGIDDLKGTTDIDVFRGDAATTSSDDRVDGVGYGGRADELILTGTTTVPVVLNVQTLIFDTINADVDASGATIQPVNVDDPGGVTRVEIHNSNFTSTDHRIAIGEAGQIVFKNVTTEAGKSFEIQTDVPSLDLFLDGLGDAQTPVNLNFVESSNLSRIAVLTEGGSSAVSLSDGSIADHIREIIIYTLDSQAKTLTLDLRDNGDGPGKLTFLKSDYLTSVDAMLPDMVDGALAVHLYGPTNRIDMGKGYDPNDNIVAYGNLDTLVISTDDASVASMQTNVQGIERLELTGGIAINTSVTPKFFGVSDVTIVDGWLGPQQLFLKDFGGNSLSKLTIGKNVGDANIVLLPTDSSSSTDIIDITLNGGATSNTQNGIVLRPHGT